MSSINVTTTYPTGGTLLPNAFVDYYMIKANGEYVKVYIYLLRMVSNGQKFNIPYLADLLELTERDICRALKYWKKENLLDLVMDGGEIRSIKLLPVSTALTIDADDLMEPDKEEPAKIPAKETTTGTSAAKAKAVPALRTLTPSQLAQKNKDDKFSYLIYIAEMYIGRPLTANDLNTLSYFYDNLAMSPELIEHLVDYCVSNGKKNFRYMQSVAIAWYQEGIRTADEAKLHCQNYQKEYYQIMHAFGLNNQPAPAQIEYMKRWLKTDGFDLSIVIEACNRTIRSIGQPKFQYTDSILKKWKDNHVVSLDDVKKLESRPGTVSKSAAPQPNNQFHNFEERDYDYDELEKQLFEKQIHPVKED